jgi:hypothetical protein
MFWALFAHTQEALHKRHLVYCVCVLCQLKFHFNPGTANWHIRNIPSAAYEAARQDEEVMLETCRGH